MAKKELNSIAKWDGKTYERKGTFYPNKETVKEIAQGYRDEGFCASIDKRKAGWFVWVSKEKRTTTRRGGRGGSKKTNYENMYWKEKGNLKKLSLEYSQLKLPKSKTEISDIRKRRRNYLNKKKLTPTQSKRLKDMDRILKKVTNVEKTDVLLKMKIKKSKDKLKEIEKKMKEQEEKNKNEK